MQELETKEQKAARDQQYAQALAQYKQKVGGLAGAHAWSSLPTQFTIKCKAHNARLRTRLLPGACVCAMTCPRATRAV